MDRPERPLQQTVNIFFIVFASGVVVVNFFRSVVVRHLSFLETLPDPSAWAPLILLVFLLVVHRIRHSWVRYAHVFILTAVAAGAIFDEYDSFYGLGFISLAIMLGYKYGFMKISPIFKLGFWALFIGVLVRISVLFGPGENEGSGMSVLVFFVFYLPFLGFLYQDDIRRLSSKNRTLADRIENLYREKAQLSGQLNAKNQEIRDLESKVGADESGGLEKLELLQSRYGLTPREHEIMVLAYRTSMSNSELGEALYISPGTVKQHLNRIFEKVGVRGRTDMQVMVREFLRNPEMDSSNGRNDA